MSGKTENKADVAFWGRGLLPLAQVQDLPIFSR
jgi:hypothetical protein